MGNDLDQWEMAQICGEMTQLFDKRLKNVENDSEIWESSKIFRNGLDSCYMSKVFEKRLYYVGNGLRI